MKPKEPVLKTLNFEETDRTPVNFSCTSEFQEKLYRYFDIKNPVKLNNPLMEYVDPQILKALNCDFRYAVPAYTGHEIKFEEDGSWVNLFGIKKKPFIHNGATYYRYEGTPLMGATTKEVKEYKWPQPDWFDYSVIAEQCNMYKEYGIITGHPGNVDFLHKAGYLYGIENVYKGLVKKDPVLLKIFEKISDFFYAYNKKILEAGNGLIDIVFYGDDYGGQYGPLIGEKTYREIFQPFWKKHYDLAQSYGCKVMHHSCGAIWNLLPVFHETGVDIIDPLDVMDDRYKKWYNKLIFHGGLDFSNKSVVEILENLEKKLKLADNKGYIISPTTIITAEVPVEYVVSVYEKFNI